MINPSVMGKHKRTPNSALLSSTKACGYIYSPDPILSLKKAMKRRETFLLAIKKSAMKSGPLTAMKRIYSPAKRKRKSFRPFA